MFAFVNMIRLEGFDSGSQQRANIFEFFTVDQIDLEIGSWDFFETALAQI